MGAQEILISELVYQSKILSDNEADQIMKKFVSYISSVDISTVKIPTPGRPFSIENISKIQLEEVKQMVGGDNNRKISDIDPVIMEMMIAQP